MSSVVIFISVISFICLVILFIAEQKSEPETQEVKSIITEYRINQEEIEKEYYRNLVDYPLLPGSASLVYPKGIEYYDVSGSSVRTSSPYIGYTNQEVRQKVLSSWVCEYCGIRNDADEEYCGDKHDRAVGCGAKRHAIL